MAPEVLRCTEPERTSLIEGAERAAVPRTAFGRLEHHGEIAIRRQDGDRPVGGEEALLLGEQAGQALLDRRALGALRERLRELRAESELSPSAQEELETLTRELARRMRSFADAPERARTAVRKALKRALDEIQAANPAVGDHLAERVETGAVCCYHLAPAPGVAVSQPS